MRSIHVCSCSAQTLSVFHTVTWFKYPAAFGLSRSGVWQHAVSAILWMSRLKQQELTPSCSCQRAAWSGGSHCFSETVRRILRLLWWCVVRYQAAAGSHSVGRCWGVSRGTTGMTAVAAGAPEDVGRCLAVAIQAVFCCTQADKQRSK